MRTRELGRTGLRVTPLGFGAAPVGGHYGDTDDAGHLAAVRHAIDLGINLIDTSPYYSATRSETLLGEALGDGYRDRVVLATKAGRNGLADFDFSAAGMLRSLEASLRRLRTDHVDIWFAHDIEFATDFERVFTETADALRRAKAAGKCRFVGITGYPPGLLARAVERCDLDVVLNYCHFSLTNSQMLTRLVPVAERQGTGLINASALMMGLFASKGPPAWHPAPEPLKAACARVRDHCRRLGADPEVLALQYVLQDERIACTLVGMSSVAEVDTNLRALDDPLKQELLAEVLAILEPVKDTEWPSGNWPTGQ
ncbi:MAG TPA: aldo/keto reductase [Gemmataceae bacterium]|jgi:L-galactose dehydrogenase